VPIVSACFKPSTTCDCVGPEVDVVGKEPAACCKVVQEKSGANSNKNNFFIRLSMYFFKDGLK
jgi:hypothetical protein